MLGNIRLYLPPTDSSWRLCLQIKDIGRKRGNPQGLGLAGNCMEHPPIIGAAMAHGFQPVFLFDQGHLCEDFRIYSSPGHIRIGHR